MRVPNPLWRNHPLRMMSPVRTSAKVAPLDDSLSK